MERESRIPSRELRCHSQQIATNTSHSKVESSLTDDVGKIIPWTIGFEVEQPHKRTSTFKCRYSDGCFQTRMGVIHFGQQHFTCGIPLKRGTIFRISPRSQEMIDCSYFHSYFHLFDVATLTRSICNYGQNRSIYYLPFLVICICRHLAKNYYGKQK